MLTTSLLPPAASTESLTLTAIQEQARELGFPNVAVAHFDGLPDAKAKLDTWLAQGMHGSMDYMLRNAHIRANPSELLPSARSALLLRMDYLAQPAQQLADSAAQLEQPQQAQLSLYAHGRDYHTVLRNRLKKLVLWLQNAAPDAGFRIFTDSAPVMEVALAQASGLGWRGKHTLLLNRDAGSTFFLGGILTTLDLNATPAASSHCGQCSACLDVCPTQAIVAPYVVDARRCISYLTIEHEGAIDPVLRPLMGNRIYGCDDCQSACPWNKFAQTAPPAVQADFTVRNGLDASSLLSLWAWTEDEFLQRMEGSAIRRIGHARWLRNIATALGNALSTQPSNAQLLRSALTQHAEHPNAAVREHVAWALSQDNGYAV